MTSKGGRVGALGCVALAVSSIVACNAAPTPQSTRTPAPAATAAPATASAGEVIHLVPVSATCRDTTRQLCDPPVVLTVWTEGALVVTYTANPGHCSPVIVHLSLDGTARHSSAALDPGMADAPRDLGPVTPGPHELAIQGEGVVGGCNSGGVASWGGSLELIIAAPAGPYPTPRVEAPPPA